MRIKMNNECLVKEYTVKYLPSTSGRGELTESKIEVHFDFHDKTVLIEDLKEEEGVVLDLPTLKDILSQLESTAAQALYTNRGFNKE